MDHIHGKPKHLQTQNKIQRDQRTVKDLVKLGNYIAPQELKAAIKKFVY